MASCAGQPHIRNTEEFKRETKTFIEGLKDRNSVEICYAKSETTPDVVRKMAIDECRRFGKTAVFTETSFNLCPLRTPVAAVFSCLTQEELRERAETKRTGS